MAGWAVAVGSGAAIALRRKFSASQLIADVRRYGATYANYVGKPLSYILATPDPNDDADNPLRIVTAMRPRHGTSTGSPERFGVQVIDGFGSTEGGVNIARTPDTPAGALGPLPEESTSSTSTPESLPARRDRRTGERRRARGFRGYYNEPDAEDERMAGGVSQRRPGLPRRSRLRVLRGPARRLDARRRREPGHAPIERVLMRYPDVIEVAVYAIPAPDVGDRVMAALVLTDGACSTPTRSGSSFADQPDLGPKQWPAFVRISTGLPRTETFKVIKRQLSAEGTDAPTRCGRSSISRSVCLCGLDDCLDGAADVVGGAGGVGLAGVEPGDDRLEGDDGTVAAAHRRQGPGGICSR